MHTSWPVGVLLWLWPEWLITSSLSCLTSSPKRMWYRLVGFQVDICVCFIAIISTWSPCCPQALLCSSFVPGYCGMSAPSIKGVVSIWWPLSQIPFSIVAWTVSWYKRSYVTALCRWRLQQHAASTASTLQWNLESVSVLRRDGHLSRRHTIHVGHGREWNHFQGQLRQQHQGHQCALPNGFRGQLLPFA